jgi:hypothetical protein
MNIVYVDSHLQHNTKLVLHFIDTNQYGTHDLSIFVVYNSDRKRFYVVGKNIDTSRQSYAPYSFCCEDRDIYNFINNIIVLNMFSMTLYNYNKFEDDFELPIEYFEHQKDTVYEITSFEKLCFNNPKAQELVKRFLNMIQYAF